MGTKYFFKIGDNNPLVQTLREFLYSRFYITTPNVQVCSVVFDSSMQSMLAEYRKFHGLDRQSNIFSFDSLLDEATYEQIGSEMSDGEIAMASPHARALRILFVCLVCIGIGQSMLFSILPPAARAIGISPFQVSTIFAISASIWVFVSPWWGRRSDVRGRRPIIR